MGSSRTLSCSALVTRFPCMLRTLSSIASSRVSMMLSACWRDRPCFSSLVTYSDVSTGRRVREQRGQTGWAEGHTDSARRGLVLRSASGVAEGPRADEVWEPVAVVVRRDSVQGAASKRKKGRGMSKSTRSDGEATTRVDSVQTTRAAAVCSFSLWMELSLSGAALKGQPRPLPASSDASSRPRRQSSAGASPASLASETHVLSYQSTPSHPPKLLWLRRISMCPPPRRF